MGKSRKNTNQMIFQWKEVKKKVKYKEKGKRIKQQPHQSNKIQRVNPQAEEPKHRQTNFTIQPKAQCGNYNISLT
jgi:adenylosuccinate synthase